MFFSNSPLNIHEINGQYFPSTFISSLDPEDQDIAVPEEFAMILRVALSKMVSAKCLNPEMINLDFWRRMPNKFRGIRFYENTKNKNKDVPTNLPERGNDNNQQPEQPLPEETSAQQLPAAQAQAPPAATDQGANCKKMTKKGKPRKKSSAPPVSPAKKKKKKNPPGGETVEEECEDDNVFSTYGESIYEDFDNV